MKINTLYNIFSKLLISRYLRSLTFLCAFLLLGFNGFGQAVTIEDENGNEDDGAITITATLDIAVPGGFTVDVSTVDGTATIADNDYTAVSSFTLTFAGNPGEQQFFTILPTFDSFVELDEDLTVNMANLSGTIAIVDITDSATITINNDDSDVITMGAGVALSEGNAGTTAFNFTANRTGATTSAATATFTVTGVSANAADFDGGVFPTGLATFAIGSSTAAITINVSGDTAVEANETFTVTLSAPSAGYTLGAPSTATGTINNDDSYTASITATDPTATEAGTTTGQFTVDLGTTNTS
ncbi:MAG: Calx-beta domain-containing protein, partial [Arenibacter sp.]